MSEASPQEARNVQFNEVPEQEPAIATHLGIKDIASVRLSITADLGQCTMLVRDVLELKRGSVVALDKLAGEMTDIYVNEIHFAKGEVVVIADSLHVRIADITGSTERDGEPDEE